jgi:hypothetical protein
MNLVDLLTEPRSFFADRSDGVSITPALGVVLAALVLEAIRGFLMTRHTLGALPAETRQQAGTILYLSGIGATVAVTLVVWLAIGGILWSGFAWISGVAAVQEIDESDAFVVVAVPVVVLLGLSLLALL